MSGHGHFSSYEGHMERRTGKIRGASSRMHKALDSWRLARAPASPAQGLHHHGPRYFIFPYFGTMCGLRNMELLIKTGWNLSDLLLRTLAVGRRQQEPFCHWSVPSLVESHNVLSRFGSLLV